MNFTEYSGLVKYMRIQSAEKTFQCSQCDKDFAQIVHLGRTLRCIFAISLYLISKPCNANVC